MSERTATEQVLGSEFDDRIKIILLRSLMHSECRDCAREAHKALHKLGEL